MKHLKVLQDKLEQSNNDIILAKEILSYLFPCQLCKNHCINVKRYYVHEKDNNGYYMNKNWRCLYMCFECMKETMINHHLGKNGVLTVDEHLIRMHSFNELERWKLDRLI